MSDEAEQRCKHLEQLLSQTIEMAQQLEYQRDLVVQGAAWSLDLLKKIAQQQTTVDDRTYALFAISKWLDITAQGARPPIKWPSFGSSGIDRHQAARIAPEL